MTSPFSELRLLSLIEGVEAIATNTENVILFEIGAVVGNEDVPQEAFTLTLDCDIDLGDNAFADAIEKVMVALCEGFRSITSRLFEIASSFALAIEDFMRSLLTSIIATMENITATVTRVITDAVVGVVNQLKEAVTTIINTLATVVDAIADQVRNLVNALQDIVAAIFDKISTAVTAIVNKLGDVISAVVNKVGEVLTAIKDLVGGIIGTVVDAVWEVITRIGAGIANLIDVVVGTAEAGLGQVRRVIEDIPSTLRELATDAQEFIGENIGGPLSNIGETFITQVEGFFARLIDDLEVSPEKIIRDFLTGLGLRSDEVERIATSVDRAMPRTPAIFVLVSGFLAVTLLPMLVSTIFAPVLEEARQEVAQRVTPTLIPPAETIDAFLRGNWDEARLTKELGEAGFSKERQDTLILSSRRVLEVGELLRWWRRDIINDNQLTNLSGALHIVPEDVERLKEATFFIPPVQDLIRMAVREVFTPEIRQRFGQDEGFPAEFAEFGKKQGVSDFWARNYWAAHWVLPSVTQGFAMLHRKVIEPDDLDLLLRAQDVMPFWREKVTQIAFNPLTRVDLRRMHRLGLLDSDALQLRYEDLGFSPDNAALMVQFTEAFNEEEPAESEIELSGLTRSTILGLFDDGILSESETDTALQSLGVSVAAAQLFITQRTLEKERRDRADRIKDFVRLAKGGHITIDQAQDGLSELGLTTTEVALAMGRILNDQKMRDRLPTQKQLGEMLAGKILVQDEWETAMAGIGFSDVWIDRLARLAKPDAATGV